LCKLRYIKLLNYSMNKKFNGHLLKRQTSKKGLMLPKVFLHMKTPKKGNAYDLAKQQTPYLNCLQN
jgi:hypothetical protein